jgi:hypothetical protein
LLREADFKSAMSTNSIIPANDSKQYVVSSKQ